MEYIPLLKVLVGSHAFNLQTEQSDKDYVLVYTHPTRLIFSVDYCQPYGTHTINGQDDTTAYELQHFLRLSLKGNPTVLHTYVAPIIECSELGIELRNLFPYVWHPDTMLDSAMGFINSQKNRKRNDHECKKWVIISLRTLACAYQLLWTQQDFYTLDLQNSHFPYVRDLYDHLYKLRHDLIPFDYPKECESIETLIQTLKTKRDYYLQNFKVQQDVSKVSDFLYKVRLSTIV